MNHRRTVGQVIDACLGLTYNFVNESGVEGDVLVWLLMLNDDTPPSEDPTTHVVDGSSL